MGLIFSRERIMHNKSVRERRSIDFADNGPIS